MAEQVTCKVCGATFARASRFGKAPLYCSKGCRNKESYARQKVRRKAAAKRRSKVAAPSVAYEQSIAEAVEAATGQSVDTVPVTRRLSPPIVADERIAGIGRVRVGLQHTLTGEVREVGEFTMPEIFPLAARFMEHPIFWEAEGRVRVANPYDYGVDGHFMWAALGDRVLLCLLVEPA